MKARLSRDEYEERLRQVRLLIMDVDGVLTRGDILFINEELEGKSFYVRDGSAMYIARLIGVRTAVITGRHSQAVARRIGELPVDDLCQGALEKVGACLGIQRAHGIGDEEVAFIADDLIDLPLIEHAGLGIGVNDSHEQLLNHVDWVTQKKGGEGAVREVVDDIVTARGLWDQVIADYRGRRASWEDRPVPGGEAG